MAHPHVSLQEYFARLTAIVCELNKAHNRVPEDSPARPLVDQWFADETHAIVEELRTTVENLEAGVSPNFPAFAELYCSELGDQEQTPSMLDILADFEACRRVWKLRHTDDGSAAQKLKAV